MMKRVLMIFLILINVRNALLCQKIYYVQNDSFFMAGNKALDFITKKSCSLNLINLKEAIKYGEKTLYYSFIKKTFPEEYIVTEYAIISFIENKTEVLNTIHDCDSIKINIIEKRSEMIKEASCYFYITFLLRQEDIYYLRVIANTISPKGFDEGYLTFIYFAFDKNLEIKKVRFDNGIK